MATPTTQLTPAQLQKLLNGPAGTPPPHVQPNFDNPTSLHAYVIFTLVFIFTISTVAVAVRVYTKLRVIRSLVIEDCTFLLHSVLCRGKADFSET